MRLQFNSDGTLTLTREQVSKLYGALMGGMQQLEIMAMSAPDLRDRADKGIHALFAQANALGQLLHGNPPHTDD